MADITQIQVGSTTYDIRDGKHAIFIVKGTQVASTNAFTGNLLDVEELYEGLMIQYWLPFDGTSDEATLELLLKNNISSGAIPIYTKGITRLTTDQLVNTYSTYIYQTVTIDNNSYTGWWLQESCAPAWGDITGDLSNQTDLQDILNNKASVILNSASGAIASFDDGADAPVAALTVGIEPVQDLHGYDAPWPAGGGKNLFKTTATSQTVSDKVFTVNSDGSITASGTASASIGNYIIGEKELPAGTYKVNGVPDGGGSAWRVVVQNITSSPITMIATLYSGRDIEFTLTETATVRMAIICPSGDSATHTVYPMIRLSSFTDATFAPYSNICPISGHTSAVVTRTGVNIWDEQWESGSIDNSTGQNNNLGTNRIRSKNYIPVLPNTNYCYIATNTSISQFMYLYDKNKNFLFVDGNVTRPRYVFTTPANCFYIRFRTGNDYGTSYNNDISINYPATDTQYHAYQGQQLTIDLDGTRYGGTLNVLTGEMTVTDVLVTAPNYTVRDASSQSPWMRFAYSNGNVPSRVKCNKCKTILSLPTVGHNRDYTIYTYDENTMRIYLPEGTTTEEIETFNADLQIVYPLATPFTVQLTPAQLSTLLGQNNIWADTGNTQLTYYKDSQYSEIFSNKAPSTSPIFTGIPIAPTAAISTSTTQLATTGFVKQLLSTIVSVSEEVLYITI